MPALYQSWILPTVYLQYLQTTDTIQQKIPINDNCGKCEDVGSEHIHNENSYNIHVPVLGENNF